jgi:large subunit ribosomal protein L5e
LDWKAECKKYATPRLTLEERKAKIQAKIEAFKANGGGAADEDEDEEDEE